MKSSASLAWALQRLAQLQGVALDPLKLEAALRHRKQDRIQVSDLRQICDTLSYAAPLELPSPDGAQLPLLCCLEDGTWGVLTSHTPQGKWVIAYAGGMRELDASELASPLLRLTPLPSGGTETFRQTLKRSFRGYRATIWETIFASIVIGLLSLGASMFSMQIYDRVIPTRSEHTLVILSIGVILAIMLEMAMKVARAYAMDSAVVGLDSRLSRDIFQRLLDLRIDQLPPSVGSLAGQLRGYEQIRGFYTSGTLFALVDVPLGVLYLIFVVLISSPVVALIPFAFGLVAIVGGYAARLQIQRLAVEGAAASNVKTGLLVEVVEGAETIKTGGGGWKFLSRWINVTGMTIRNDLAVRHMNEGLGYFAATLQQMSYVGVIVIGAWQVMEGHMTTGALIACSILSGRIMAPVLALPGLLVQHAHAVAAMQSIERLYKLESDTHGQTRPLAPTRLRGDFSLEDVRFSYPESPLGIHVQDLKIRAGEKVAIVGPIGAGKSTLLRLLAGLYKPQQGRVLIDGLDMAQISRAAVSQQLGYLQQEHRLFQGTLRENLLIGLPDPGDDLLMQAMTRSGLLKCVSGHPKGLDLPIYEGGKGLSGGQRQLVAFTRLLLCNLPILLVDEPTANMDASQEASCIAILNSEIQAGKTLIMVTHKDSLLSLVDRIVVVIGNRIVMDGPRASILARLGRLAVESAPKSTTIPAPTLVKTAGPAQPQATA
jgi:ATP-binding cassette, subfamily C, bacterial LapB